MKKQHIKQRNIYIFLITLSLIGLISGTLYYEFQPNTIKTDITNKLNIQEELNNRVNNLPKSIKESSSILIYSVLIIPSIINIFNIFYNPFKIGFLYNVLKTYSLKLSIIYILIYQIIPYLFQLILTKISITLIYSIIKKLIYYKKESFNRIILLLKKYFIISIFLFIYEILIIIISKNINSYLMTFL